MSRQVVNYGYYEITTRPIGFWRNVLWDVLPYWQGTKAKFKTELKPNRDIPDKHHFLIIQQFSNLQADNMNKLTTKYLEGVKEGDIIPIVYETENLFDTGTMFLVINSYEIEMKAGGKVNIYSFHVTHRSWLYLAIIAGLIAGLSSFLFNLILSGF